MNIQPLPTFDLILFGGTGDLAMRKLLPALYRRCMDGHLSADSRVIGIARTEFTREQFIARVHASCQEHLKSGEYDLAKWETFATHLHYLQIDVNKAQDYVPLGTLLAGREQCIRMFFFSTAPTLFTAICEQLAKAQLVTPNSRVVLEKPLGHDLPSATAINELVGSIFTERQIFRIDHYLGKETVQNLIALRFGNTLFEPLWQRGRIRHVQITVAEQIGVEGRGTFYDQTGALRDMVQSHLLQLLCIMAMEPPSSNDADAVRDEKLKVLRALRPITSKDVLTKVVRGQYKAGTTSGTPVVGYLNEVGVPPSSHTETFVAVKAEIDTWRWAGVPFYLRTGKRLSEKLAELVVTFEDVPHSIFDQAVGMQTANRLVIRLQPDESITLTVLAKKPGEEMLLVPVDLSLDFGETFALKKLDAYERLMTDVIKGNLTLFMRRDELDAAWRWIDPIREGLEHFDDKPKGYVAGTWGPAAGSALLVRDGFSWHEEA